MHQAPELTSLPPPVGREEDRFIKQGTKKKSPRQRIKKTRSVCREEPLGDSMSSLGSWGGADLEILRTKSALQTTTGGRRKVRLQRAWSMASSNKPCTSNAARQLKRHGSYRSTEETMQSDDSMEVKALASNDSPPPCSLQTSAEDKKNNNTGGAHSTRKLTRKKSSLINKKSSSSRNLLSGADNDWDHPNPVGNNRRGDRQQRSNKNDKSSTVSLGIKSDEDRLQHRNAGVGTLDILGCDDWGHLEFNHHQHGDEDCENRLHRNNNDPTSRRKSPKRPIKKPHQSSTSSLVEHHNARFSGQSWRELGISLKDLHEIRKQEEPQHKQRSSRTITDCAPGKSLFGQETLETESRNTKAVENSINRSSDVVVSSSSSSSSTPSSHHGGFVARATRSMSIGRRFLRGSIMGKKKVSLFSPQQQKTQGNNLRPRTTTTTTTTGDDDNTNSRHQYIEFHSSAPSLSYGNSGIAEDNTGEICLAAAAAAATRPSSLRSAVSSVDAAGVVMTLLSPGGESNKSRRRGGRKPHRGISLYPNTQK